MGIVEILLIAIGLAMDAFAVSLAAGASRQAGGTGAAFRLSFHFGLFQFIMPVIGWYAGIGVAGTIAAYDHWVAFGLLALVGIRMIVSGTDSRKNSHSRDPSRGLTLLVLSVATSIDALAVGLSLAMIRVNIWYPSIVIGLVTACLSIVGLRLGGRLGVRFGKRMEIAGGGLLVLIGMRILLAHIL
ncbi:MAG TPA: manganese efflux pump MntP family protein [Myxococcota bacterium]|nr:manganese efflux pump MntP family protein [Myxococcota bacterium]